LVQSFVDCLYAIGVVVCHCQRSKFLSQEIHAAIDDAESVKMDDKRIPGLADRIVGNTHVLLLEESGESRSEASTVRFSEDGDRVIVWLIVREFLEPRLGKVPEGSRSILGRI